MSTALRKYNNGQIFDYTVAATKTVTAYKLVEFSGADNAIEDLGAGEDLGIGVALDSGTAGQRVRVLVPNPVVPMLVGTGGATRGKKAVVVADGVADAPAHDSSGGTDDAIYGIFMQSGIATNRVGVQLFFSNRGSA